MTTLPEFPKNLLPDQCIYACYRGSVSHGMYRPKDPGIDDLDVLAVIIGTPTDYLGRLRGAPFKAREVKDGPWDIVVYELRHFCTLLAAANPNVLSALWVAPQYVLHEGLAGEHLRKFRTLFSSLRAYHSFGGYAHGQLKRMTAFHDEGEADCCSGTKFHTDDCKLRAVKGRGSQKKFATGYMGAKRKALVQQHGYDTKNAAHLIRLLRMGIEFLKTGELVVDRQVIGDAEELLEIKAGGWSVERVQAEASRLFEQMRGARDQSPLKEEPDEQGIDQLLVSILRPFIARV